MDGAKTRDESNRRPSKFTTHHFLSRQERVRNLTEERRDLQLFMIKIMLLSLSLFAPFSYAADHKGQWESAKDVVTLKFDKGWIKYRSEPASRVDWIEGTVDTLIPVSASKSNFLKNQTLYKRPFKRKKAA